ncbi:MAG: non-canonical purine NTP pyrophosphatase, partial [Clostridiales bacterium]|nr:non-canonical purine NTP pyrophosphatase [Clostridiales bacterium]
MDVLAATNNKAKLREMREILAGFRVLSMADAGISAYIPETGGTFAENALIKADAAWRMLRGGGAGGAPAVAGAVADAAALDVAAQAGGFGPLAALT